jgi:hypothetical protein
LLGENKNYCKKASLKQFGVTVGSGNVGELTYYALTEKSTKSSIWLLLKEMENHCHCFLLTNHIVFLKSRFCNWSVVCGNWPRGPFLPNQLTNENWILSAGAVWCTTSMLQNGWILKDEIIFYFHNSLFIWPNIVSCNCICYYLVTQKWLSSAQLVATKILLEGHEFEFWISHFSTFRARLILVMIW